MAQNYREPNIIFNGWVDKAGTGIIVTGAASGIGAATAILAAQYGMTQSEIADVLCISRTRISRLLQEAQEKGIVRININYNLVRHYELERRLCETFQLKDAYVFNNRGKTPSEIADGVARLAAFAIQERLRKDSIVGITWGNTVASTVNAMVPRSTRPFRLRSRLPT